MAFLRCDRECVLPYATRSNKFLNHAANWAERGERVCVAGYSGSALSAHISSLTGNTDSYQKSQDAEVFWDKTRSGNNFIRFAFAWKDALSGHLIFEHNDDLSWKKDANGHYVVKDWKSIAMGVGAFIARNLSLVRALHTFGAFPLSEHSNRNLGTAIMSLWGAVCAIDLCVSLHALLYGKEEDKVKNTFCAVRSGLDLAYLPFDFGVAAKGPPALAIFGYSLGITSALFGLFVDCLFYDQYSLTPKVTPN